MTELNPERNHWNRCRFSPTDPGGHYESYFQRANHPIRPLAFWIRYTIFSPTGQPEQAVGELWAIYFDGEAEQITAAKAVTPIANCEFSNAGLGARIDEATLRDGELTGSASSGGHTITWSLQYTGDEPPVLLLPRAYYERGFPKAKALVGAPNAIYHGSLTVDGKNISIEGWVGSQNHNWGSKHTDRYAWGQVAGFDDAPGAFLELSTARLRLGPFWTPWLTLIVLRLDGQDYALNTLTQALRARGRFGYFHWSFDSRAAGLRIHGQITALAESFVGLRYANPPGGAKTCLNTKLARCELTLEKPGEIPRVLITEHRAAFEILTDDAGHGIPIVA